MVTKMRKASVAVLLVMAFAATPMFAQSSGNFAATVNPAQCVVNDGTGALTGGIIATYLDTNLKTPNSSSTALVIRPSLVTGLFTKTKVTTDAAATAVAGVRVRVLMDGRIVAPGAPAGAFPSDGTSPGVANDGNPDNDGWIYYDKRFQQLSTNLFSQIDACGLLAGDTDLLNDCYIELILSTLSAHSYDFVAGNVGGGSHNLRVDWSLQPTAENANEKACVGPGVISVQQVKTFSTGDGIVIQ